MAYGKTFKRVVQRLGKHPNVIGIIVFAVLGGSILLLATHAATSSNSIEPEDGSVSGSASSINDSAASGGRAVKFGTASTMACGLVNPAFCDTFDAPAGIGNRSGQLNGNVWGVSRALGDMNVGQHHYEAAPATSLLGCDGLLTTVRPPNDVIICNGQLRESTNDNPYDIFEGGTVTALAMYPKQPFNFAGRTGKIAFDVSNDTHGGHAAWPEIWMSDLPVPVPFNHFDSWQSLPQNGFGIRMAAAGQPGNNGYCPGAPLTANSWTVDSAVVSRNWIREDTDPKGAEDHVGPGTMTVTPMGCVTQPADGSGVMNHVEIDVSQNQIDVYATDAGTTAPLKLISRIANANLTLSQGLVWMEDVHYNADKGGLPSQKRHTFVWDNFGFDGPFTYKDLAYDALDNNEVNPNNDGTVNLGRLSEPGAPSSWDVLNLPANRQAAAVRVLFNFMPPNATPDNEPTSIDITVNGHAHSQPWPYPASPTWANTLRADAITIPISDLVTGTNVVTIGSNQELIVTNVDIVLVNAQ